MRNNNTEPKIIKVGFFASTCIALLANTSCDNKIKVNNGKEMATDYNDEKFDYNNKLEEDTKFLVEASKINLEEIRLGQISQVNSLMQ